MIKKLLLGSAMSVMSFGTSVFANGHGTHVAGTFAAIGNNAVGGYGRDILIGGAGVDHVSIAVNLLVAGVQYLVVR